VISSAWWLLGTSLRDFFVFVSARTSLLDFFVFLVSGFLATHKTKGTPRVSETVGLALTLVRVCAACGWQVLESSAAALPS
jgi:hypothetical protein